VDDLNNNAEKECNQIIGSFIFIFFLIDIMQQCSTNNQNILNHRPSASSGLVIETIIADRDTLVVVIVLS